MIKVTVVIPTHGGPKHIVNAIESVLNQTYKNIEIIVVDDNGKDTKNQLDTFFYLKDYIQDNKIKYIIHDVNKNGSAARNTGWKSSTGDYICFLDDDDEFEMEKIKIQVESLFLTDASIGGSYSSKKTIRNGKLVEKYIARSSGDLLFRHHMHKVRIGTSSMLLKRHVLEEIKGFDESFWRHQDWEFVGKILNNYKLIPCENAFFLRNLTFRHNPENIDKAFSLMNHYLDNIRNISPRLTDFQIKRVYNYNLSLIAQKFIRNRRFKEFLILTKNKRSVIMFYFLLINFIKYPFNKIKR